jgi:hypothetical protein
MVSPELNRHWHCQEQIVPAFAQIDSKRMPIFRRTGDARAMLAHCKSLMAFEQKGGFAMVERADWVPSACLTEVARCHLSRSSERDFATDSWGRALC